MLFSIITPSFRDSDWLKLCVSSVADQGVDLEHIVQDGGSDDGTLAWLLKDKRVKPFVERDSGMYDAINRGLRRAAGQILAYLNCDEQYLPGTLKSVADYFRRNPAREVVFSDTIVANATGNYICHRRASLPRKYHTLVSGNLAALTCSIFFRRSVISQHGIFFDPHLEHVGDCRWVLKLIEKGIPRGVMPSFTSVFSDTGTNISLL